MVVAITSPRMFFELGPSKKGFLEIGCHGCDQWIHQLVINSAMAELRVFAFKTMEEKDEPTELDKFEEWINARVL